MKVNYNAQAIIANNKLKVNDNKLSESIGRLSTGLKIKNAKDNPSGLAMARRMNAQIEGMGVAGNSAKDGMNIIKTADGVLNEIHDILQRMNELAVKGATSTITPTDRDYIESEIQQLKDEIGRIASTTDFNGQTILDGTFDYRGYATVGGSTDPDIRVASYSDNMAGRKYTVANVTATYEDVLGDEIILDQYIRQSLDLNRSNIYYSYRGSSGSTIMTSGITIDGHGCTISGSSNYKIFTLNYPYKYRWV